MSDRDDAPKSPEQVETPPAAPRGARSRLRRFFLRHVPLAGAAIVGVSVLAVVGLYFVASSAAFENAVRKRLIAEIETATGGRAEIRSFHWRLLHLEAEADGVVIHGLEDAGEAPYAQIDRLRVQLSIFSVFSPRVLLHSLEVDQPQLHLIIYADGSTNQPRPRRPAKSGRSDLDKLFDLKAGHISVERGTLDFESRATEFDFQDRYAPLDFQANDFSVIMRWLPASANAPGHYRVEAGATDLNLSRTPPQKKPLPVHGAVQLTLDLERNRLSLSSLRLTAHSPKTKDRALEITGVLEDFTHPHWQAKTTGDLDMQLLEPITGYTDAPEGIAHLDLNANGEADQFRINGHVHVENGAYIGNGITATGLNLDADVLADAQRLLISPAVVRLRQGGQIDGTVDLQPWLTPAQPAVVERAGLTPAEVRAKRDIVVKLPSSTIPMDGKVSANFRNVTIDTVLDMVSAPPYQRLGLDAQLNGPATANWSNGESRNLSVAAVFGLSPSARTPAGEAPTTGAIDATYVHRTGAVDLRRLELHLPGTELEAHGALGAYPVRSPSSLTVDFHSHNLGEFDTVLRSLGYSRNGKAGTAALPISLAGQADFHGSWTGSLTNPHIAGELKATQIAFEMPSSSGKAGQSQFVRMDSVDAAGSYSETRIALNHATLLRGQTRLTVNGTLDASPEFNANSVIHARADAANLDVADLQPFLGAAGQNLPVAGTFTGRFQADGPIHAPAATASIRMDQGTLYGESITQLRIDASMANRILRVSSVSCKEAGGSVSASGSYDLKARTFQVNAHGSGIDLSRVAWIHQRKWDVAGKLGISLSGSGSVDDPHLDGQATVSTLALSGQRFGGLQVSAHAASHALTYTATTQLEEAKLTVQGHTALSSGYATQARLDFSQFNIGALLRMAHIQAFSGQSALEGTVTLEGPLEHPEQLRGEARLRQLAVTIAGVQLQSEGGAHATLADGRVHLDPLHVTGEDTDLRTEGSVAIQGARQLDLAASGSINLKLAETLDPDLTARGVTTFQVEAHGPLQNPNLKGRIDFQNGSLSLEDIPNGLSQLHGTLEFNQNRLEVKSLTAMTGGGLLSVGGYLAYQHGIFADLTVTGKQVHIRYPQGVSSQADATLQLQGPQNNLLLSGNVLITRFTTSPDLDLASLAAQTGASVKTIAPPDAPSNHVRLDVHITSSPQLNFQNAFAKLAGDVDLRLRGTVASPSLLGRVSITQGSALIAGTRYDLERGDVSFTNPVRIEPNIDLSATAHVEDYDISLGLHGSPQKLAVTYRSDPPLPEADVVSLLALGHTASQQRLYTQQQEQAISNPTTDALLGGALNATVSNRIQKLFGAGSVKVDPNYLGAFGNSTSRITVEEQFGRTVTLTYATNVNTTSQQLLQAEVAVNRHVSVVVARDESGVFSMVIKATRRYR